MLDDSTQLGRLAQLTRQDGAALDALTYFAAPAAIRAAADALEAGEFRAWSAEDSAAAAKELRALLVAYHHDVAPRGLSADGVAGPTGR